MIYVVIYLVIAAAVSFIVSIGTSSWQARVKDIPPEKIAIMSTRERQILHGIATAKRPRLWHLVVVGLLWPVQIVLLVVSHLWSDRINKRADAATKFRSPCPGCARNLVGLDGTDAIEDRDTDRIRFVCGACATISDWRFSENGSTFLGRIGVAKSL